MAYVVQIRCQSNESHLSLTTKSSQPIFNTTPAVIGLIALTVIIHLIRQVLPDQLAQIVVLLGGFSAPIFLATVLGAQEHFGFILALTPLTYAFLHGDFVHLAMNMAFLLAFGTAVERYLGWKRFLGLYLVCGIIAVVTSIALFFLTHEQTIIVGASGAISGLFGAVIRISRQRALVTMGIFIAMNLIMAFTGAPGMGEMRTIAWETHIGGFVAGYLLLPLFDYPADYYEEDETP